MQMNCWYCKKHRSVLVCSAGKPFYAAYSDACKSYYQMSVIEGRRDSDSVRYAWLTLVAAMRAYYAHAFQQG